MTSSLLTPLPPPEITLLIENPSKGKNWGPLLRCCSAFGISKIYVVGYDQCSVQGSHGASKHVQLISFPTHQAAVDFLTKQSNSSSSSRTDENNDGIRSGSVGEGGGGFELVGLLNGFAVDYNSNSAGDINDEDNGYPVLCKKIILNSETGESKLFAVAVIEKPSITASANNIIIKNNNNNLGGSNILRTFPVQSRKFVARRTCLVVDRTTGCLPWSLAQYCTRFVHIPHFGEGGGDGDGNTTRVRSDGATDDDNYYSPPTTWITMEACVSIVLHEFAEYYCGSHNNSNNDDSSNNKIKDTASNYNGQKYQVDQIKKGGGSKDSVIALRRNEERQRKRLELQKEATDDQQSEEYFGGGSLLNGSDNSDY
jgi:hypothetical protein